MFQKQLGRIFRNLGKREYCSRQRTFLESTKNCNCEICKAEFGLRVWKRLHEAGYRTMSEIRKDLEKDHRILFKIPGFGRKSLNEFLEIDAQTREKEDHDNRNSLD